MPVCLFLANQQCIWPDIFKDTCGHWQCSVKILMFQRCIKSLITKRYREASAMACQLNLYLQHQNPKGTLAQVPTASFPIPFLVRRLGKQYRVAQVLTVLHPLGRPTRTSWLQLLTCQTVHYRYSGREPANVKSFSLASSLQPTYKFCLFK